MNGDCERNARRVFGPSPSRLVICYGRLWSKPRAVLQIGQKLAIGGLLWPSP